MPTNFKTYDAQARLLASLLAAHPELKPNYKEIAKYYGRSQTVSAIEHRFRPLRSAAEALRTMVQKNLDPDLLSDPLDKNAKEIARLFGESTPDGIQFQFRGVKSNAEALKTAVKDGKDPVEAFAAANGAPRGLVASGSGSTPGSRKHGRSKPLSTPKSRTGGPAAASAAKRTKSVRKKAVVKYEDSDEDGDDSEPDFSELDRSPTNKKVKTTPSKMTPRSYEPIMIYDDKPITIPDDDDTPSARPSLHGSNNNLGFVKAEAVPRSTGTNSVAPGPLYFDQFYPRAANTSQTSAGSGSGSGSTYGRGRYHTPPPVDTTSENFFLNAQIGQSAEMDQNEEMPVFWSITHPTGTTPQPEEDPNDQGFEIIEDHNDQGFEVV